METANTSPGTGAELLSVDETACMLGVSRSFVYQHAHQLPRVKIGHIVKFRRVELDKRILMGNLLTK